MTAVFLAAGFGNWVFSDRCRAPLIVWGRIFPNCTCKKSCKNKYSSHFLPSTKLFKIVRCQALNHRADAGVIRMPSLGLPYPRSSIPPSVPRSRSLEADNSISLNEFNCHVRGHQRSLVPFLGLGPLPGI